MSLIVDMKTLISGTVYLDDMPDTPDNVVALYHSGGYPRDLSGGMVEEPTFQVRVRNASAATALTKCETIKDALHGVVEQTINGNRYLLIAQMGDIQNMGKDSRGRPEYSMNFRVYVER